MHIRRLALLIGAAAVAFALTQPARAELTIHIDKSTQHMIVALNGAELFDWPVSTGARGYDTPSGEFKPFRMEADHFSREWDDAPMPHSIFFTKKGHAIHGSNHLKAIGTPASHGCVRLEPRNARILFDLVRQEGMGKTRVVLVGEAPDKARPPVVAQRDPAFGAGRVDRDRDLEREYRRGEVYRGDDDGIVAPRRRQRTVRQWREYNDGPRYYYYRERPYYPPPRQYGYETPYPFPFGR